MFFTHSRFGRLDDSCACKDRTPSIFTVRTTACGAADVPRLLAHNLAQPFVKAAGVAKADTVPAHTAHTTAARQRVALRPETVGGIGCACWRPQSFQILRAPHRRRRLLLAAPPLSPYIKLPLEVDVSGSGDATFHRVPDFFVSSLLPVRTTFVLQKVFCSRREGKVAISFDY